MGTAGSGPRIARIEWGTLTGTRPHPLGKNARLPEHGAAVRVPLCRITTTDGAQGIGPARRRADLARGAVGLPVEVLFTPEAGTRETWLEFDYPLWDLAGRQAGLPVYRLAGDGAAIGPEPPSVACYDTSLYFDELLPEAGSPDDAQAVEVVAVEAAIGYGTGPSRSRWAGARGG